jgi:FMN reductase
MMTDVTWSASDRICEDIGMQISVETPSDYSNGDSTISMDEEIFDAPFVVGLGGTFRTNSSSERALAMSLHAAERSGAKTLMISGPKLALPFYGMDNATRSVESEKLISALRRCDGVIISAAAYHGTISGLLKNALDYTEELRGGHRSYLDGVAVGCIACGAGWQAATHTLTVLRTIIHSLRGWPTPLGAAINTSEQIFDAAGGCLSASVRDQLEIVGRQVVDFACRTKQPIGRIK